MREALFSMIGQDLEGLSVLDAFAGSGLLGLEAWSRGAEVTAVDRDRAATAAIRRNAAALGARIDVRDGDVLKLASGLGMFDGVLLDPPYALEPGPILAALAPLARRWIVLETAADQAAPDVGGLVLDRRRCYGGTALWVFRRAD